MVGNLRAAMFKHALINMYISFFHSEYSISILTDYLSTNITSHLNLPTTILSTENMKILCALIVFIGWFFNATPFDVCLYIAEE